VVAAACQFVFLAVLARLLDPAAFGLMAMCTISLRFAGYFAQMGVAQAVIQRPELAPVDTTAALLMALGIGALLYAGMVLAAPLFAVAFRAPELSMLISVLGLSLVLSTLGGLPIALLRRQARFKRVNAIEVFSYIVGYGAVGIWCAMRGLGVWSLVAATLSQQALLIVAGFLAVRYPLAWPVPYAAFAQLWRFGSRYSLIGFLEFLWSNVESLFIGRSYGKVDLGLYNRAITLTNLPVEFGVSAVTKVLFPALAGMQRDPARLADGFLMLLLSIGIFSSALACGIAGAASTDATVVGADGRIVVYDFFGTKKCALFDRENRPVETFERPVADGFIYAIEHFAGLVREGALESPLIPLRDTIACAEVFDRIRAQCTLPDA